MDGLRQDLRFALRQLRRSPGFTAVAVLTLALGIGATTAIYSVVDGVLLDPLPYEDPSELVILWGDESGLRSGSSYASYPDFVDFREEAGSLRALAATVGAQATLTDGGGEATRLSVARATRDLFTTLGVRPLLGRAFAAEEDAPGGGGAAILSHAFWMERFGGDPEVLGRTLRLDGRPHEVVGVMPAGFDFPNEPALWLPLLPVYAGDERGMHRIFPVGRLAEGATLEEADAEVRAIAARLEEAYPTSNANRSAYLEPLHDALVGEVAATLWVVLAMVGLVLLVACANVGNLMLARATERDREVAVRSALGAGRGRLARQLVTEGLVLATCGGVAAVGVAAGGLELLRVLAPADLPRVENIGLGWRVLGLAAALVAGSGVLLGALPALRGANAAPGRRLAAGGRTEVGERARLPKAVVVLQVAMACVAMVGAGLLLNSFLRLQAVDPGFRAEDVLVIPLSLPEGEYFAPPGEEPDGARTVAFYEEALRRVGALPGVASAAAAYQHPLSGGWESSFTIPGVLEPPEGERPEARLRPVTPGYFRVAGIPLLEGRAIERGDDADAPGVVVVNRSFARAFLPGRDPIGHTIARGRWWSELPDEFRIVGVVADVKMDGLAEQTPPSMYFPHAQMPFADMNLAVRAGGGDPLGLLPGIRSVLGEIDPQIPVENARTLGDLRFGALAPERFRTILVGLFGAVTLTLAAVGLYGLLAYRVARRRREIGLRVSLGARSADVLRLVVGQGMRLVGLGLVLGLGGALLLSELLSGLLYGVRPTDPLTLATVAATLLAVALLACLVPGLRATRVDPMIALQSE